MSNIETVGIIVGIAGLVPPIISLVMGYIPYIPQISIYSQKKVTSSFDTQPQVIQGELIERQIPIDTENIYLTIENVGQTTIDHLQISVTTYPEPPFESFGKLHNDEYRTDFVNTFQAKKIHDILLEAYIKNICQTLSVGSLPPTKNVSVYYGNISGFAYYNHFIFSSFEYHLQYNSVPTTNAPYTDILDIYKRNIPLLYDILCISTLTDQKDGEYIWECLYFLKVLGHAEVYFLEDVYSKKWHGRVITFLSELSEKDVLSEQGLNCVSTLIPLLETLNVNFQKTMQNFIICDDIRRYTSILLNAYEDIFKHGIKFILPDYLDISIAYTDSRTNKKYQKIIRIDMNKALNTL